MRVMGLDYGDKTVGVAISDELLITAQPIETVERERTNKLRKTYQRIEALIAEYEVEKIVLGRPLNMNGTEGDRVELTEAFAEELSRRTGLEIIWMDERLTTVEANRILEETGVAHSARKEHIDKMAAAIILQTYLDTQK
ncbi:MAG: Holliday junction resolvase RuvX [Eubacterium sp.]|nr:Holliday junction resolvase RuvX [Eubacterium sp.]